MKRILSILLTAALVLGLAACGSSGADNNTQGAGSTAPAGDAGSAASGGDVPTIKVGILLDYSGASAYQDSLQRSGYEYAAKYYNERGGIASLGGAQIELVFGDHAGVAETGISEFERLVNQENIDFFSGTNSSTVMAAVAPLCEKYEIPCVISQASSLGIYQQGYTYIFNPGNDASTNAKGLVALCEMIQQMYGHEFDGVGFIAENSEWGKSQLESFSKYFDEAGMDIIYNETFEKNASDFSTQISKLKSSGCEIVVPVISSYSDAVLFVRQLREYKCTAGILACGGVFVVPEFAEALGDDANYIFSTDTWNKDFLPMRGEDAVAIHQGYVDIHGHNMNENAGMAWIATSVLVAALEEAGSTEPAAVRDALYNLKLTPDSEYMKMIPFEGVVFDQVTPEGCTGRNIYGISTISQLIDGEWRMVCPNEMLVENPIVWPIPE